MPLAELAPQSALKVTLHRGRADSLPPAQTATLDSVQVLAKDHPLKRLRGRLAGLHAGKPLPEIAPAAMALKLTRLQPQYAMPESPVLMPHAPLVAAFVAQPIAPAVRTQSQPGCRAEILIPPPLICKSLSHNRAVLIRSLI